MSNKSVKLSLKTTTKLDDAKRAKDLIALLATSDFRPAKYSYGEPVNREFSTDDLTSVTQFFLTHRGLMFKKSKPFSVFGNITCVSDSPTLRTPNEFYMLIEDRFFKSRENIKTFLDFAMAFYEKMEPLHGFIAHEDDVEAKNRLEVDTPAGSIERWVGRNLEEGLPGTYWANFFGSTYVDWFGEDKFTSLKIDRKEKLRDGGYLLVAYDSPLEFDSVESKKIEEYIARGLGESAFFNIRNTNRKCKVPSF